MVIFAEHNRDDQKKIMPFGQKLIFDLEKSDVSSKKIGLFVTIFSVPFMIT